MISFTESYRKAMPVVALAISMLPTARAFAGIEYVTPSNNCTNHVANAGETLTILAGQNVQFEVWGNSIDLSNRTTGFKFNAPAGFSASIVQQRSGATNSGRGCGFVGSAVVQVTAPTNLAGNTGASLSFTMPLGDKSNMAVTIVAHPTFTATWTTNGSLQPSNLPCIVKTGSLSLLNQDLKLVINLPPGSAQDQTTCTNNVITVKTLPASIGHVDIVGSPQKYTVSGLPAFLTETQPTAVLPMVTGQLSFTFNINAVRTLTSQSTSTITITDPTATNRSVALTLVVVPSPAAQGFSQVASANPVSSVAGNLIDFTINLSRVAGPADTVTWRMTTASCFTQAIAPAPYNAAQPFQFFSVPQGQTAAVIRVRSVRAGGCVSQLNPTTHIFEAWIGSQKSNPQVTAVTSGPTYTKTTINLLF
jgi:hypothetical protein